MSFISRAKLCAGARSCGVQMRIDSAAMSASGTLIVKIDCQPKALTKSPPITGPTAVVEKADKRHNAECEARRLRSGRVAALAQNPHRRRIGARRADAEQDAHRHQSGED